MVRDSLSVPEVPGSKLVGHSFFMRMEPRCGYSKHFGYCILNSFQVCNSEVAGNRVYTMKCYNKVFTSCPVAK